ncbi:MAG: DUF814 domain-containing protein [Acidobacteria bacterium]|nr:DUF814 domain-containing protein [Acidobacteriota bacterium]
MLEDFHLHHLGNYLHRHLSGRHLAVAQWTDARHVWLTWQEAGPDLYLSLEPDFPVVLTPPRRPAPPIGAWSEAHFLAERLLGLPLGEVKKVADERLLILAFGAATAAWRLVVEVRPIVPGLWLVAPDGTVTAAHGARWRTDEPFGVPSRPDRLTADEATLRAFIRDEKPPRLPKSLPRRMKGLSPTLVEEGLARVPDADPTRLAAMLADLAGQAYATASTFHLYTRHDWSADEYRLHPRHDFRLAAWPLESCREWKDHSFPDIETPIRRWAEYARRFRDFTRRRERIRAALDACAQESSGKIFSLEEQLLQAAGGEEAQRLGELILANLHRFGAGFQGESVTVTDFYEPEATERVIALDPERSLKENAGRFFQQYRKSRAARERLPGLLAAARQRAARFEGLTRQAAAATREAELDELAARVPAGRRRHADVAVREKKAVRTYQFRRYETANGIPVLVGRSATENDRLTFRVAGPNDIWFHVRDYRGSHVILQWGKKNDPPPADLRAAAAVAAHFSEAADSPLVDVHWTRRKFVQKVKGTPGLVRLARSHTLRVAPGLPEVSEEP